MTHRAFARMGYAALKVGLRLPEMAPAARFSQQGKVIDLLKELKIDCVLDVGANDGMFAKHLRMAGYRGNIYCFEPITAHCDSIQQLASGDPGWQVFNFALGSESGVKQFNIFSTATMLSSFLTPVGKENLPTRIESITIKRMDDVLDELLQNAAMPRIFLKIDTQGYDVEVLKGCVRWIGKISLLQSEVSVRPIYRHMKHYTEALEYYESLGFSLLDLHVVNRGQDGGIYEYDCVMARLDRLNRG
jgi:FkbM family methyltransferase